MKTSFARLPRAAAFALSALAVFAPSAACIESPQEPVEYDAVGVGTGVRNMIVGGWNVELSRATVAVGPFYFCAAQSGSSTLCEASVAELRTVTAFDALATAPMRLGRVHGFSGTVKSAAYDLGISWFDTQNAATPSPAAPGGHSARIEGTATRGETRIAFVADVDVAPQYQGQNAVPTAPADANVVSSATRFEIVVDPVRWVAQLDFDAIASSGLRSVAIRAGSPEHNALLVGIKNLAPPLLRWVPAP